MWQAIELCPTEAVYFSNRAAAYTKKKFYPEAMADAEECIHLRPDWAKGYSRKATCLQFKGQTEAALETYQVGLEQVKDLDERKQLQRAMMSVLKEQVAAENDKGDPTTSSGAFQADPRFGPKAKPQRMQPQKARLTICILLAMMLGPATNYVVGWGPSLMYSICWCAAMAAGGIMIVPEKEAEAPVDKGGWWYRLRPWLFPALYWNQHKYE